MDKKKIISCIPIFVICFVPLLVFLNIGSTELATYDWFSASDTEYDFFLICKAFVTVSAAIFMLLLIEGSVFSNINKLSKQEHMVFIPVAVYILFAIISALCAGGKSDRVFGGYAQHESVVVLCAYIIIFLYTYTKAKSEYADYYIKKIFLFIFICAGVLSFVGVSQFLSCDVIMSDAVKKIITFGSGLDSSRISLSFPDKTVYMTLYNPNYVGSFVCLVLPIVSAAFLIWKNKIAKAVSAAVVVMLVVSLIGSDSQAGMIGLICEMFIIVFIFAVKKMKKNSMIACAGIGAVLVVVICIATVCAISSKNDVAKVNKLTQINIVENEVQAVISGKTVNIDAPVVCEDYSVEESESPEGLKGLNLICDGNVYFFTNDNEDGRYYYRNVYGKYTDDFYVAPKQETSFIPENFASGRGYIWNRTFPLIKDNIFIGCGPDNFAYEFPNNDYVGMTNNGYAGQVMTRPHNMYLQTAVQTGLISLVAFLALYVLYSVYSVQALRKCNGVTKEFIICAAVYTAVSGYMICGLANDSTVCVAPIFWLLLAAGFGYNMMIIKERK